MRQILFYAMSRYRLFAHTPRDAFLFMLQSWRSFAHSVPRLSAHDFLPRLFTLSCTRQMEFFDTLRHAMLALPLFRFSPCRRFSFAADYFRLRHCAFAFRSRPMLRLDDVAADASCH